MKANMRFLLKCFVLVFFISIFSNCSVQKRAHRKGYYISWNHTSGTKALKKEKEPVKKPLEELVITEYVKSESEKTEASTTTNLSNKATIIKPKLILSDTCGDLILMRDGTQIVAKVLEISDEKIKYKRCDNLDGPTIITSTNNVHTIKFVNGVRQTFELSANHDRTSLSGAPNPIYSNNQRTNPFAIAAFVLSILGVWPLTLLGSIIGLIFAIKAERDIAKNPDKFKGKGLALAAKIISLVMIVLVLLILVIFVLAGGL